MGIRLTDMKTTIELSDALLTEARKTASKRNQTLRELFETALRRYLAELQATDGGKFTLRKHSYKGHGLQPGIAEGDWAEIRRRAYEGHGG